MALRLLFLDVDGVLNSTRSFIAKRGAGHMPSDISQLSPERIREVAQLDEVAVGLLRRIVEESGCELVLSSTWRMGQKVHEINCLMKAYGLPNVRGRTAVMFDKCRGDEIQDYLDAVATFEGATAFESVDYVILDDDSDMLKSQTSHLVRCDPSVGLAFPQFLAIEARWFPTHRAAVTAVAPDLKEDTSCTPSLSGS